MNHIDQTSVLITQRIAGRYFTGEPVWEFGTGLSYSTFSCTWQDAAADAVSSSWILRPTPSEPGSGFLGRFSTEQLANAEGMAYTVVVKNTGKIAGDYVALAFVSPPNATTTASDHTAIAPQKQLFGFGRVSLAPSAEATIDFLLEMGAARGDRLAERRAGNDQAAAAGLGGIRWSSASVDAHGRRSVLPGEYRLTVTDSTEPRWFEATGRAQMVQAAL